MKMDLEAFLVGEIGKDKVEELKLEGCDLSQQYREGDGVLTVLNDLLNWDDSTKGYDYWYAIAHVEYNMVTKEQVDKAEEEWMTAVDAEKGFVDVELRSMMTAVAAKAWDKYIELEREYENESGN